MSKRLDAMKANPKGNWRIADVEALCREFEIVCDPPKRGDHYKVRHLSVREILTIPARRPIKPIYIRKLVSLVEAVKNAQ